MRALLVTRHADATEVLAHAAEQHTGRNLLRLAPMLIGVMLFNVGYGAGGLAVTMTLAIAAGFAIRDGQRRAKAMREQVENVATSS